MVRTPMTTEKKVIYLNKYIIIDVKIKATIGSSEWECPDINIFNLNISFYVTNQGIHWNKIQMFHSYI